MFYITYIEIYYFILKLTESYLNKLYFYGISKIIRRKTKMEKHQRKIYAEHITQDKLSDRKKHFESLGFIDIQFVLEIDGIHYSLIAERGV
jgi:hypothetical protein